MSEENIHELDPSCWVDEHGDYLLSYAISRIRKREIAEDLVQETFLSAYRARGSFRGGSSERTWLISILKRKVIDHYRKQSRNPEASTESFEMPFHRRGPGIGGWMIDHSPSPWDEDLLEDDPDGLMEVIRYCISLLSPQMAATFSMKAMDEISTAEICKELDISESNVWVLLHRARLQLRECIENNWFNKER